MSSYVCIGIIPKGADYEPADCDSAQTLFSWGRNSEVYEQLAYACSEDKYRPLCEVLREWVDNLNLAIDNTIAAIEMDEKALRYCQGDCATVIELLERALYQKKKKQELECAKDIVTRIQMEDNIVVWLDV